MDSQYFDYAATYPARDVAIQAMIHALPSIQGNPSSPHALGRQAQLDLQGHKIRFLDLVHCGDGQLVLTASASESNNLVIEHFLKKSNKKIAYAVDAHACMKYCAEVYPDRSVEIPVNRNGEIGVEELQQVITDEVGLVCLSHVSHETGVAHDVAALCAYCDRLGILSCVDGSQALGHIPVIIDSIPCDYYSYAAHKFGGIIGSAGLIVKGTALTPRIRGGTQEYGMRAGTENLPAFFASVSALEQVMLSNYDTEIRHITELHDQCETLIKQLLPAAIIVSEQAQFRSPSILCCIFPGVDARILIEAMSIQGFYIASGSACTAAEVRASDCLIKMGFDESQALSAIRISFGIHNTLQSVRGLVSGLVNEYKARLES